VSRQQATNRELGQDTARDNLLTNGGFEIWQRGTSFNGGAITADRWQLNIGGMTAVTTRVAANSVDATKAGYCLGMTVTAWTAHSELLQYLTDIIPQVAGRTVSLSIRVWCSAANAVRIGIYDTINSFRWGTYHPGGSAYQTLTLTAVCGSATTVFGVALGIDANCSIYVDDAMLVVGPVAADYAPLHPVDDLTRCLRYYEILGDNTASTDNALIHSGYAGAGGQAFYITYPWKVHKAILPTVTKVGSWGASNCAQPSIDDIRKWGCRMTTGSSAAGPFYINANGSSSNYISSEANP
jgi:hypothetical protein